MIVSIITPLHNAADFFEQALESVLSQTYDEWELIIIDDRSTDNSVEIVKSYLEIDNRINLIQLEKNYGAAVARNAGIEIAKGRYIAFLDSDDIWYPEKLERQLDFMQKNDVAFSFSKIERVNEAGRVLGISKIPGKVDYYTLLKTNVVACSSAIYDTEKLGKVYMPEIRKRQDFALWLRLLKSVEYGYGIQEVLLKYVVRQGSVSANKVSAACYTWRVYRELEQLPFLTSLYYFMHYVLNAFIRLRIPWLAKKLNLMH